jgi:hypothetical protein
MKRLISLWSDASSLNGAQRTIVAMSFRPPVVHEQQLDYSARIKPERLAVKQPRA